MKTRQENKKPAATVVDETHVRPNAWPFVEAAKLIERFKLTGLPQKGYVLFQTGYGPSGLPHIGTVAEVVRTTMVRHAFEYLSSWPTRLFCFSDDMDALLKVPENVPQQELLQNHLGKPLTKVPDPFGTHQSFGHHNNARLKDFLNRFDFDYELQSSTEWYMSGRFDSALLTILNHYQEILDVMLPTLGPERAQTYSPFLPISPITGRILQTSVISHDPKAGTIVFKDEDETYKEIPVTGGHCKLQWKPDWAMRWYALDVDYEMFGKDLIPSMALSSQLCQLIDHCPPEGCHYELFLDEKGQKISKSKGTGLSVMTWLEYAPFESLVLYMYQKLQSAKRLSFEVIPRLVDTYQELNTQFHTQSHTQQLENPVWHIHNGAVPQISYYGFSLSLLLNLASAAHAETKQIMWGFISRYDVSLTPERAPYLDQLVGYAVCYYQNVVKPRKFYRAPTVEECNALVVLLDHLQTLEDHTDTKAIQHHLYEVGNRFFPDLRLWFQMLYEVLLGQTTGPRMGSFITLYGIEETCHLLRLAIDKVEK